MDDEGYRGDIVGCVLLSFKLRAFSLCKFTVSAFCTKARLFILGRNQGFLVRYYYCYCHCTRVELLLSLPLHYSRVTFVIVISLQQSYFCHCHFTIVELLLSLSFHQSRITFVTVIAPEWSFYLSLSVCQIGELQPCPKRRSRYLQSSVLCNPAPVVLRNPTVLLGVALDYIPLSARTPILYTDSESWKLYSSAMTVTNRGSLAQHDIKACRELRYPDFVESSINVSLIQNALLGLRIIVQLLSNFHVRRVYGQNERLRVIAKYCMIYIRM